MVATGWSLVCNLLRPASDPTLHVHWQVSIEPTLRALRRNYLQMQTRGMCALEQHYVLNRTIADYDRTACWY